MPILGVIASGISGHLTPADTGAMFPIASYTVPTGGVASITFNSIPSTYTHLQVRLFGKCQRNTYSIAELKVTFNGDTGNNYAGHYLTGTGNSATVNSSGFGSASRFQIIGMGSNLNSQFGSAVLDILDYASTSKYKTARILNGIMSNVAGGGSYYGNLGLCSGLWQSTSAITSINIAPEDPVNFSQYTNISLYGIK